MIQTRIPNILFGGDYCPEQWTEEIVDKDVQFLKAANVNTVVLSIFTWALIEPRENEFHFEWLDLVIEKLSRNNISICLATPTCAQPAWMSQKYPEILPVDRAGRKRNHGMRVFFCVNSQKYRQQAAKITRKIAERYKACTNLIAWHVANEYGTYCYCDTCQKKFREWLRNKYGTIERLNEKWHTVFWGRQVYKFDEIMIPSELNDDYRFNPAVQLDYLRFVTDSTLDCYLNEANILKEITPEIPVYTNISGHIKSLDQYKMAKEMDFVGWDNYPSPREEISSVAFKHDLMRSLKKGDPYLIAEQSPNQQNWQAYNKVKRPGELRTIAYQGIAHGGEGCFYFQMKQSIGGQEKFHGAVIGHSGEKNTRIYNEISALGKELALLGDQLLGTKPKNKVAIYFDWDSWWDLENASGPSKDMDYLKIVTQYYQAFFTQNIAVDVISKDTKLEDYELVIAPALYMIPQSTSEEIEAFVQKGGTFVASFRTGVVDENDRCVYGLAPGLLQPVLGLAVEETDALYPDEKNRLIVNENYKFEKKNYESGFVCDLINTTTAKSVAIYGKEFYSGMPAVTENRYGKGQAYYIGTSPEPSFLNEFFQQICEQKGLCEPFSTSKSVEIMTRQNDTAKFYFVINHNDTSAEVDFKWEPGENLLDGKQIARKAALKPREVIIFKKAIS